jgi:hypothetical protein
MENRLLPRISGIESLLLSLICWIVTALFVPWSLEFDIFAVLGLIFLITGLFLLRKNHTTPAKQK